MAKVDALQQAQKEIANVIDTLRQVNLLFTLIASQVEGAEHEQCYVLAQIGGELATAAGARAEEAYFDASQEASHG